MNVESYCTPEVNITNIRLCTSYTSVKEYIKHKTDWKVSGRKSFLTC